MRTEGGKKGGERDVTRWLLESPDDISLYLGKSNCICHYVRLEALTLEGGTAVDCRVD